MLFTFAGNVYEYLTTNGYNKNKKNNNNKFALWCAKD